MRALILAALAAALPLAACGPSAKPAGKSQAALLAELPAPYNTGDVAAGQEVFSQCTACHTIQAGLPNGVGPNLHGVFGRMAGSKADFAYSPALKATGWTWDAARIDAWITDP